jgi:hypothetical protein
MSKSKLLIERVWRFSFQGRSMSRGGYCVALGKFLSGYIVAIDMMLLCKSLKDMYMYE